MATHYTPAEFAALVEAHAENVGSLVDYMVDEVSRSMQELAVIKAPGRIKMGVIRRRSGDGYVVGVDEAMIGDARFALIDTGIYGPEHRPIRSGLHRGLPITTSGGTAMFRRSSKGSPRNRFFDEAVEQVEDTLHGRVKQLGDDVADLRKEG